MYVRFDYAYVPAFVDCIAFCYSSVPSCVTACYSVLFVDSCDCQLCK